MTAYSFKSYAARERTPERTQLVTIKHGHPLNNDHRAPFSSGSTAARALMAHVQRELGNPETGPAFFNQMRQIHDGATISGERVKKRLQLRQSRAATALSNSDVDLTGRQLELTVEIAQVQAEIAAKLLPEVQSNGRSTDSVIDDVDIITRTALRSATALNTGDGTILEGVDPNEWSRLLIDRIGNAPDIDHSDDADVVTRFTRLVYELERELPLAIDRDEPLWEIPDAIDPTEFAQTRNQLSLAQGADFNPDDAVASEELDYQARSAIWTSMDMDEREFAATKVALTASQRIEVGMQIVNSTPPLIQLPEAELGQGRFDVRMATEEEATVMDALIKWAGEARTYPGAEQSVEQLETMKSLSMPSGDLGIMTYGLAVANDPASISHASTLIRGMEADRRLILHVDNPQAAQALMAVRNEVLAAAGIDRPFMDGSDATREFGGWTLPGENDRILGGDPRDAQVFVATTDKIIAYNSSNSLDVTGVGQSQERVQNARSMVSTGEKDLKAALEAAATSRNPELVDAMEGFKAAAMEGKSGLSPEDEKSRLAELSAAADASADKKLVQDVERRKAALKASEISLTKAQAAAEKLERQSKADAFNRATTGEIARAQITEAAHRQGKLHQVFTPAMKGDKTVVQTKEGGLVEQRGYFAARKAETLLDGDSYRNRDLRDALGAGLGTKFNGRRALTATVVGGSNWFSASKGAAKGIEALNDRLKVLPKNGVILIDNNDKNPVVQEVLKLDRRVLHATAWRVTDKSNPISDGRRITLSERKTELDLGVAINMVQDGKGNQIPKGRSRQFNLQDMKNLTVVVHGGGQMTRNTYDEIQKEAARSNESTHGLTQSQAMRIYDVLEERGVRGIEKPRPASAELGRAIMQEAEIDYADQVILGTDSGRNPKGEEYVSKDYHWANLARQAIDSDKVSSIVNKHGEAMDMVEARAQAAQYAPSISDNTRRDLGSTLSLPASGDFGQLILGALPGVSAERAGVIGQAFETLGDVMVAAENGEASVALPPALHHELGRPAAWASAVQKADDIADHAANARMDGLSATSENYPETLKEAGRTPMIYTLRDVELNVPTVALIVGGKARPTEADLEASRTIAQEAQAKGWAVSIHMNGPASAEVATEISKMSEAKRPRILLIGDGHPTAHGEAKVFDAILKVAEVEGGGYATVTAPRPNANATEEQLKEGSFSFAADRRAALEFQARQASAVVVLKTTGNDIEMMAVKTAILEGKPIAAVGPEASKTAFRGTDYSGNVRLLAGGDAVTVMLESRHLAFQPNFIPDMTAQTENRYVPFEGSTAGKTDNNDRRGQDDEVDRSAIESSGRVSTTVEWGKAAENVQGGRIGDFLTAVEAKEIASIEATPQQSAARGLENDARFLDMASRSPVSAEVRAVFAELQDVSDHDVATDVQDHFLRQRAGASR